MAGTFFGNIMYKPYIDDYIDDKNFVRTFFNTKENENLFIWHEDLLDRLVKVIYTNSECLFQFDNQMPFEIKKGDIIEIPKRQIHRIILPSGVLVVQISEV